MGIAFYVVLAVAVLLAVALYFQVKAAHDQAGEQQQLLTDYQRRVDEQQRLLDDYRALEKNFENVGQGYEQALELYDKIEEEKQKLEQQNTALQAQLAQLQESQAKQTGYSDQMAQAVAPLARDIRQQLLDAATPAKLRRQVNALLDMGELGNETPIERTDEVSPERIAALAAAESGIREAGYVTFSILNSDEADDATLRTNLQQAAHALALLLDNSMKFVTTGGAVLKLEVADGKCLLIVEDTGSGIPAEDADRVFEPYVKLNSYFDGAGLGLTIARSIARRLGGDLTLDTTYTAGARFVLSLPL